MTRQDNDVWDLTTGVGATATLVAAARAAASAMVDPLVVDPFAEHLVTAVGVEFLSRLASGDPTAVDQVQREGQWQLIDWLAVRTKFFDDFFFEAGAEGVRQIVILGSGLDSRAYRLPWPRQTTLFEIDLPRVLSFKSATLDRLNVAPKADLRLIPADLRDDWTAPLLNSGFDASRPTAWCAEGLLAYLPLPARDALIDRIHDLSAIDSWIAFDSDPAMGEIESISDSEDVVSISDRWKDSGFDLAIADLVYFGKQSDPKSRLSQRGWRESTLTGSELFVQYGFDVRKGVGCDSVECTSAVRRR